MPIDTPLVNAERDIVTGLFFRVERDGRWENIDAARLTDAELDTVLQGRRAEYLARFGKVMAGWIRDNVRYE